MIISKKGEVAIVPPSFEKIEAKVSQGFAVNQTRTDVIYAEMVMAYYYGDTLIPKGAKVVLKGDAGLQSWARNVMVMKEKTFCFCPESQILGFIYE